MDSDSAIQKQDQTILMTDQSDSKSHRNAEVEREERFGHKPTITYRSEIDGLRTLAIVPVICFHFKLFPEYTSGGFAGVDVFFVISGFLVNSIIISELLKEKFTLLVFYERRVRRLFPAIFLTLVVSSVLAYQLFYSKVQFQKFVEQQTAALGSVANIYFYAIRDQMKDGYFDNNTESWPFLHFWSLAVEEQFYFFTPILLMVMIKLSGKQKFIVAFFAYSITTILISLIFSIKLTDSNHMFAFYLLPCRAWELGLGGLVAILLHEETAAPLKAVANKIRMRCVVGGFWTTVVLEVLSWMGLVMVLASYYLFQKKVDLFPGYKALLPVSGTALFILCNFVRFQEQHESFQTAESVVQEKQVNRPSRRKMLSSAKVLSLRPFVWIGEISYSLYLWHWIVWVYFGFYMAGEIITEEGKYLCVGLTLLLADFSTTRIEDPIRNKKKVPTSKLWKGFAAGWIVLMATFICILFMDFDDQVKHKSKIYNPSSEDQDYARHDSEGYFMTNPYHSFLKPINRSFEMQTPVTVSEMYQINVNSPQTVLINYSEKDKQANKRVCVAALGSGHTTQHIETLISLAYQYQVSLAVLSAEDTYLQFFKTNSRQWDEWRIDQLNKLSPHTIFSINYWRDIESEMEEKIDNSISHLLKLQKPPEQIYIFGDNPSLDSEGDRSHRRFSDFLLQEDDSNRISEEELQKMGQKSVKQLIKTEKRLAKYIRTHFDRATVKFYPHLHQYFQDSDTKRIQIAGAEVNGELLFSDFDKLSKHGSERFRNYFEEKVFLNIQKLCG